MTTLTPPQAQAHTPDHPDTRFNNWATQLGHRFDGELVIGGNYTSTVHHGDQVFVSGQVPRVGNTVMVVGAVGRDVTLAQAQVGAQICAMRALALLKTSLGSLAKIKQVLRMTVYTHSSPAFTQQSEVADAASHLLHDVLGAAGTHTRTSVGVAQLPKGAAVELDLVVGVAA
jgi:enamine deaminase RidA (YjgF/YER057c/UK114 family)